MGRRRGLTKFQREILRRGLRDKECRCGPNGEQTPDQERCADNPKWLPEVNKMVARGWLEWEPCPKQALFIHPWTTDLGKLALELDDYEECAPDEGNE